jgi:hypothetical protein
VPPGSTIPVRLRRSLLSWWESTFPNSIDSDRATSSDRLSPIEKGIAKSRIWAPIVTVGLRSRGHDLEQESAPWD